MTARQKRELHLSLIGIVLIVLAGFLVAFATSWWQVVAIIVGLAVVGFGGYLLLERRRRSLD